MNFRCARVTESTIDGNGISLVVYFQGCSRMCFQCHNPTLWDHHGGYKESTEIIKGLWRQGKGFWDSLVFLGGEPLEQQEALIDIAQGVECVKWLYTGYELEDVPEEVKQVVDVIVAGPWRVDLATGAFPASSNQKVWVRGAIYEFEPNIRSRVYRDLQLLSS
jgi:anaerobic ribonucleoside-triphosphate reductase activating protein